MRKILLGTLVVATLVLPATPAGAAKPQIIAGEPFEAVIPFPDLCPQFELVATVRGRTHTITFLDSEGNTIRGLSAGQLFVTWTRTDTDFSRTFAISGPGFSDAQGNDVRGAGRWTTPLQGTGWALVMGNLTLEGQEDGFGLVVAYNGRATSICDLMSAT